MPRSFRSRLTATVIALVMATAAVVATTAYVLVRNSLRDQLVADAVDSSEFAVLELATSEELPVDADRAAFEETGLAERFLRRGATGVFVDFGDGDPYASSPELLGTADLVSDVTTGLMDEGRFGYQFLAIGDESLLVVAARRPSGGPDFFLYYDAAVVDRALVTLWRFLLVGVGAAVLSAVAASRTVAGGVLRPVRTAGEAAERLAAGDLAARVAVPSDDEFGRLATAFNTMAASLERQIVALEEAEARERRFVADVSHELRTPLTGLYNEAQLLEAGIADMSGPTRRAAELLVTDVGRLRRLVDELLEISRLESAPSEDRPVETDVTRFLGALVSARLPTAMVERPMPGVVVCDRRALERVVGNLLDNAAVHAPGAEVRVTAALVDSDLVVAVADDGPGVDDEALGRLFERFYTADPSRQGGSGLGLAIARRHARRMGGELTAAHRPEGGLRFELRVPVTIP